MTYLILYIIGAFVVSIVTALFSGPKTHDEEVEIAYYVFAFLLWPIMLMLLYISALMSLNEKINKIKKR